MFAQLPQRHPSEHQSVSYRHMGSAAQYPQPVSVIHSPQFRRRARNDAHPKPPAAAQRPAGIGSWCTMPAMADPNGTDPVALADPAALADAVAKVMMLRAVMMDRYVPGYYDANGN